MRVEAHRIESKESFMSYQLCRWYDPYPKLAFAFKMLYFAPDSLQLRAMAEIQRFVDKQSEMEPEQRRSSKAYEPYKACNRWYDGHSETAKTVELIKNSPETLKKRVGDELLAILEMELAC